LLAGSGLFRTLERDKLDTLQKLDRFLASVQGRAYRIAQIATNNSDDALDLVQDAMFKLVEKYSERTEQEWGPLFYRILQSRINDWHRRNKVRRRIMGWLRPSEDEGEDPIERVEDESQRSPEQLLQINGSMDKLQEALQALPLRQQQVFLLRVWEGLDVRETALAMACAEGSVKSHYSRAVHTLRQQLGEHW
jgi:RNA polymerase sigma-70 factor (ECF subfamily)